MCRHTDLTPFFFCFSLSLSSTVWLCFNNQYDMFLSPVCLAELNIMNEYVAFVFFLQTINQFVRSNCMSLFSSNMQSTFDFCTNCIAPLFHILLAGTLALWTPTNQGGLDPFLLRAIATKYPDCTEMLTAYFVMEMQFLRLLDTHGLNTKSALSFWTIFDS